MSNDDTLIFPLLDELRVCLTDLLAESPGGEPCFISLQPGREAPADRCSCGKGNGCGGQAWIRLDSTFPSSSFPTQDTTLDSCSVGLAAVIELGVVRCQPQPDTRGNGPDPGQLTEATRNQLGDWRAMRCAVRDCWDSRRSRILGRYTAIDSGDCSGGTLMVTVQLGRVR